MFLSPRRAGGKIKASCKTGFSPILLGCDYQNNTQCTRCTAARRFSARGGRFCHWSAEQTCIIRNNRHHARTLTETVTIRDRYSQLVSKDRQNTQFRCWYINLFITRISPWLVWNNYKLGRVFSRDDYFIVDRQITHVDCIVMHV